MDEGFDVCSECKGKGILTYSVYSTEGDVRETCRYCNGNGFIKREPSEKDLLNETEKL